MLNELKAIADSQDLLKRNRGRRGLDIVKTLQKTEGLTVEIDNTDFPDAKDISGYALEAMNWAVARGLINGSDGKLLPQDTATRAQIAVILARYLNA